MKMPNLIAATLLLALAGCASPGAPTAATAATAGDLRFSGTIEAVNDGCFVDGICSLTIDGREVVTMVGWSRDTWGQVEVERNVGTAVQVWCRRTGTGCELRGNPGYYVRAMR